ATEAGTRALGLIRRVVGLDAEF
ncbi:MAG: hypothetical protein QOF43_1889, partial [Gaiellaceae bacterium]|nr:hypothetical protein [Gaiellaceae bacterium]